MNSTQETKLMRTEKETAQTRRNFLRLGALGAAAVVAAGVLPGSETRAQGAASPRKAATVRSGGTAGTATGGKQTRSARRMRSKGEIGAKAEGGPNTRSTRKMSTSATQRTAKSTKSASNNRSASTRMAGQRAGQRAMKATKTMKS